MSRDHDEAATSRWGPKTGAVMASALGEDWRASTHLAARPTIDAPAAAVLIRDELWSYPSPYQPGERATRRLRVWRTARNRVACVLTENLPDPGVSITNAAETIVPALADEYPNDTVFTVEHYPHHPAHAGRYSQVWLTGSGPAWKHLASEALTEALPGLEPVDVG